MITGQAVSRRHLGALRTLAAALLLSGTLTAEAKAAAPVGEVRIVWLSQIRELPPGLSPLEETPTGEGVAGARLGIVDDDTTGRFTGQRFLLEEHLLGADEDPAAVARAVTAAGASFLVADLPAAALDRLLAEPAAAGMLIFNAGAPDDRFRDADCRPFLLHTIPSRRMLADALAQYLVVRSWKRWFLVTGTRPEDALEAVAIRRAAGRFGAVVAGEKPWSPAGDPLRTEQEEIPVFTQVGRYDVLVVADEAGLFGDQFPYRTWDPRPVAGTQGLFAAAWMPTLDQWGAAQLQLRFRKAAGRPMTARDWAAWVAVRAIGEAAFRTRSTSSAAIAARLRDPGFELAAFLGRKVSFRAWDGQLRQPIPVGWARAVVSVSPQEGFLHPVTELDTLGTDAPESGCRSGPGAGTGAAEPGKEAKP